MQQHELKNGPLGKKSSYIANYQPDLLFSIPRNKQRAAINITDHLPFMGNDIWNAFELSWLNTKGKPEVYAGEFIFPCDAANLIEGKSFKLYLNSFNHTQFENAEIVRQTMQKDLSNAVTAPVSVTLYPLKTFETAMTSQLSGELLDKLDIHCDTYQVAPHFLKTSDEIVTETLTSNLFKSNCLVTGQPDWASIQITYTGKKIDREGLLKYLISFRNHNEFHEQCIERAFVDIKTLCSPEKLLVYARFTRRGGIDINPYRANYPIILKNNRLFRQ